MHITLVYTLPTDRAKHSLYVASDQDTTESAYEIKDALQSKGATVSLVPISEHTLDTISTISKTDCIFNLIDWDGMELDLSLTAWKQLQDRGYPMTGSSYETFYALRDKGRMKKELAKHNLPVASGIVIESFAQLSQHEFLFPVIVKLVNENCSIGLSHDSVCVDIYTLEKVAKDRLSKFSEPLLIEEFLDGREFQISVFDLEQTGITVLPPAEIIYKTQGNHAFLTYESRWVESHQDFHASTVQVVKLDQVLQESIDEIALNTFTRLGFSDYCRLDIRCRGNIPYILEANVNPGLGDDEEYGMTLSYKAVGMSFADVTWEIVRSALRRTKNVGAST